MTREQFVAKHYHDFLGLILDAAITRRDGRELSLWLRNVAQAKAQKLLNEAYNDLQPVENGKPQPVRKA